MPVEVRILHGGDIACEVASVLARVLLSQSPTTKTKTFQIADYPDAGFDIVAVTGQESTGEDRGDAESTAVVAVKDDTSRTHDVDVTGVAVTCEDRGDAESTGVVAVKDGTAHPDNNTNGVFFVFVVETGEFENPADGAVSFIRDLMAACGKTRSTTKVWEARRVFKDDYARGRGGASDGTSRYGFVRYAVVAVGDNDATMERAAFRSKQNCASDCNQAGALLDRLMLASGGLRVCARLEIDVSRDTTETQVTAWVTAKVLPAVARGR